MFEIEMAAPVPSEETVGKESPENKGASNGTPHQSFESPWDQRKGSRMLKKAKAEARPSPEGSREVATVGLAMENEAFTNALSAVATTQGGKNRGTVEVEPHVFLPADTRRSEHAPKGNRAQESQHKDEEMAHCETEKEDVEKQNFISHGNVDLPVYCRQPAKKAPAARPPCLGKGHCSSVSLKAVASMMGALVISPCLLYGAFVFLPFDVPLMPTMSSRLVYTLRCGAFATFPIIAGMIVYGVSRLCFASLQPFGKLRREVEIHRRYISQSAQLFVLYFSNMAVLATYVPQEALKLIPLLTALFAISRFLYWLAFAMGRAFRGFGFGLTFLPLLAMLLFNLYSMFLADPDSLFATKGVRGGSPAEEEQRLAAARPRFWG